MTGLQPDYPVRSSRLLLRPIEMADVPSLVGYRSRPDVCRFVPFEPMDEEVIESRLRGAWSRRTLDAAGQMLMLGIELRAGGRLIGDMMLACGSERHANGEIGYVLDPAYGGRGFATEAAHRVLHLAFDDLGLHRVVARVVEGNDASVRVARRLGMRQEGHLLENEWFKGRWIDELSFALLDREWRASHDAATAAVTGCPD
ncbi:MAG: GNAT family N-acetyltransferase [Solirubrobacteraceae bacterium]